MIRSEVIKSIVPVIAGELVVCNIGLPSQELFMYGDQPSNFARAQLIRVTNGHLQHFGGMKRLALGGLGNLLATTVTIGNDQGIATHTAHGGQQYELANFH